MIKVLKIRSDYHADETIHLRKVHLKSPAPGSGLPYDYLDEKFIIMNMTGIGPPEGSILSRSYATNDGEIYQGAKAAKRTIGISILLNPDYVYSGSYQNPIEKMRQELYTIFPLKKKVTLYFQTDTNRYCRISGYVEMNSPSIFSARVSQEISIVCLDPYFESSSSAEFGNESSSADNTKTLTLFDWGGNASFGVKAGGHTTQSANWYKGEIENGFLLDFKSLGSGSGIDFSIRFISDYTGYNYKQLLLKASRGFSLNSGDHLYIDTRNGKKAIYKVSSGGTKTNILNTLDISQSQWFTSVPYSNKWIGNNNSYFNSIYLMIYTSGSSTVINPNLFFNNTDSKLNSRDLYLGV